PMLPGVLSNDACSLMPGETRRTVTVEIAIDEQGRVGKTSFYRSLIRSDVRFTYEEGGALFAGAGRAPEPAAAPPGRAPAGAGAGGAARRPAGEPRRADAAVAHPPDPAERGRAGGRDQQDADGVPGRVREARRCTGLTRAALAQAGRLLTPQHRARRSRQH